MGCQRDIRSAGSSRSSLQSRLRSESLARSFVAAPLATTFRISVSLSPQEYTGLRGLAASGQRSLGWVMRHALRELLDRQTPQLDLPFNLAVEESPVDSTARVKRAIERLLDVDWNRIRFRTSGTLHNLHPYPTRFTPGVPAKLIELFSAPGGTVLDPFCGSGTTLVEAMRLGRRAVGVDVSPLASLISRVKSTRLSSQDRKAIRAAAAHASSLVLSFCNRPNDCVADIGSVHRAIQAHCSELGTDPGAAIPDATTLRELACWFALRALAEVFLIRIAIGQCASTQAKDLLMVALSSVLGRLSYQKSDTRRTRVVREIAPRETLDLWIRKVTDSQNLLAREHESVPWPPADVYEHDARMLDFLQACSVDLVVTSPPYPNVYDYRAFQRLQLLALGLERSTPCLADAESRREHKVSNRKESRPRFERGIQEVLTSLKRVLKPSGICAFVIGPGRIRRSEDIASSLGTAAANVGFRTLARLDITTSSTTASLRKSRGSAREQITVLQA
jgi:DNA modification methylase